MKINERADIILRYQKSSEQERESFLISVKWSGFEFKPLFLIYETYPYRAQRLQKQS